jgi:hypothetical protein
MLLACGLARANSAVDANVTVYNSVLRFHVSFIKILSFTIAMRHAGSCSFGIVAICQSRIIPSTIVNQSNSQSIRATMWCVQSVCKVCLRENHILKCFNAEPTVM